jgi:alpha-L-fucosidase
LAWLFNDSPIRDTVVVDDRWGSETRGRHGGVYVCENGMFSPFCDGTGAKAVHPDRFVLRAC